MPALHAYFRETHLIGPRCQERMLDSAHFPVLREAPFIWLGSSRLRAPYRMVRLRSVHSHVVVCVSGRGRTLVEGKLVEWKPGQVLLAPVGAHHAFEAVGREPWHLAWVFFDDTERAAALSGRQARLISADGNDFSALVELLLREAAGPAQPAALSALVQLLDLSARRLIGETALDERLRRLWQRVEEDLAHPWSNAEMARLACVGEEQLRRLCLRHYQKSPGEQLTQLRLRRAATLVRSSSEKMEAIARNVGYASQYAFSNAFRRWAGQPPSHYRTGKTGHSPNASAIAQA